MDEQQYKRLVLWQQRAAQLSPMDRHIAAQREFGDDPNFDIFFPGDVVFVDHANAKTFGDVGDPYDTYDMPAVQHDHWR